jgi:excisionase family DNA binding protein
MENVLSSVVQPLSVDTDPQVLLKALESAIRARIVGEEAKREKANPARLLNVKQAAEYLGRTESAVRQMIHKRLLPVIRFDRAVRIDVRDLDRLIDEYRT